MTDANKTLEQKYRALQTANASKDATVNNLKQRQDELDSRLSRITQENEAQLEARVKEVAKKWRNDLKRKEEIAQHWRTRHDEALKEVETLKERISSSVTAKQHSHALESLRSAMNRVDASERKLAAMHTRTHHLEKALKTAVEGLVSARRVRALDAARFQIPTVVQSGVPVDPALEMAVEQKAREISQRIFNVDYDSFMAPDLSTSQDSGVDLHYSTDSNERKRYALTRLDQIMRSSDSGDELCDFLNELTTD
ncbi:hypothetical protein DFS34DRAFT_200740 [Phlyctochytrium arcticum]|nr:hypothetical protein DFS34DRAFT_200740 [Phlyctochytrium arcticum]